MSGRGPGDPVNCCWLGLGCTLAEQDKTELPHLYFWKCCVDCLLWDEPLTSLWKTPYNVCLYQSVWVQNLTCSNLSLKLEWSSVSVLILFSHHLSSISTDSGCCSIYHPNCEGCLKFHPMVCSYKIKTNLQPQPLPPLVSPFLIAFQSVFAISLQTDSLTTEFIHFLCACCIKM